MGSQGRDKGGQEQREKFVNKREERQQPLYPWVLDTSLHCDRQGEKCEAEKKGNTQCGSEDKGKGDSEGEGATSK